MFLRFVFCLLMSIVFCATAQETVPVDTPSAPAVRDSMTRNAPAAVKAGTSVDLDAIVVKGKSQNLIETKENAYTGSSATKDGIAILGGPAQVSVNQTIALLPSVNIESLDPYGLNRALQTNLMRIRGQGGDKMAYTIDGVPLSTNIRSGPKENSFDMENFADVTLYRGAAPADQGFGFGNYTGTVDITSQKPLDKPGFSFNQGAGMFGFNKIFLRAHTGRVFPGFRSFFSYSNATSHKWDSLGSADRQHVSFGADFSPQSKVMNAALFADFQYEKSNNYRGLNYTQIQKLHTNYRSDYNNSLTGDSTKDIYYCQFNKIEDKYLLIRGNLQIKPADKFTISLKPYFGYDDIANRDGSASPLVRGGPPTVYDWLTQNTRYGAVFDFSMKFFNTDLSIGHWMELLQWPIYATKAYTVNRGGKGNLTYIGWFYGLFTYDGYFMFNSPYITASTTIGNLTAHAGLKYINFSQPGVTFYDTAGIGDIPQDDINGNNAKKDTNACVGRKAPGALLPQIGFSYKMNDHVTPYVNYGRDYGICYFGPGGMISGYLKNRRYFDSIGIHADGLADRQKIPTADNFDLGIRLKFGSWRITPIGFYSSYLNKAVTIWDPNARISYRQTVGKAQAYGSELEIAGNLFSQLSLFASATCNKSSFIDNVPASATISSDIKGKQFPDCPQYMAKCGISYMPKFLPGYEISPVLRYVGNRYGDINNKEFVHSYKVGDINMAYKLKNISPSLKDFTLSFSILNVSNAEYISTVRAADETRGGATTYYVGYPLTCAWSIRGTF